MLRPNRFALFVLAMLALVAVRPPEVAAAVVEVVPFVGAFQPVELQIEDDTPLTVGQLTSGTAYGARAAWWLNQRFGLEASATVAGTELVLVGTGGTLTSPGTWYATDARGRVRLLGGDAPMTLDVLGGVGYTTLRTSLKSALAAAGIDSESRVSWIFGLGTTVGVGSGLGLRVEIEDHVHDQNFESDETAGISVEDRTQHDLIFSLGLVVPVSGR